MNEISKFNGDSGTVNVNAKERRFHGKVMGLLPLPMFLACITILSAMISCTRVVLWAASHCTYPAAATGSVLQEGGIDTERYGLIETIPGRIVHHVGDQIEGFEYLDVRS